MSATMRIGVFGLGSVLMGDDAAGPYFIRLLAAGWAAPSQVTLADLGTPGAGFVDHLRGLDAVIVLDTVDETGAPGSLHTYRKAEILRAPPGPRLSPHDPNLREALLTADLAGDGPQEVLLVGVVPERVELGTELTPRLRAAFPGVAAAVLAELERLGAPAVARCRPGSPDIWWERDTPAVVR